MLASKHSTNLFVYSFSYVDTILVVIFYIALLQVLAPHHCMSYPKYQTTNEIRSIWKNIGKTEVQMSLMWMIMSMYVNQYAGVVRYRKVVQLIYTRC